MKKSKYLFIGAALLLSACGNNNGNYDASGVFETTDVIVSANGSGEILHFDIEEGQDVRAGEQVGYIDTIQLHLKKKQLTGNLKSVESRYSNVNRQIASIEQQITTQKNERKRYENLVKSNAANQKQLDDIIAQIELLEKQLDAQKETLENNNSSIDGDGIGLQAQIEQIEDQIQKNMIYSPINGTILTKYAEQGELATQGRSLFKVADIENMNLRVYITADQLTILKLGQQVKVFADHGKSGNKEYSGTIIWISDKAEFTPKTIQTRDERANLVYAIKVGIKNDGYIKKGMYGEIKIN